MSLRSAIKEQHDAAEAHPLTAVMLSGRLTPYAYADLIANQLIVYRAVEEAAKKHKLLVDGLERSDLMEQDLLELMSFQIGELSEFKIVNVQRDRLEHLDQNGVLAHLYVNHMADIYGGQILKSKLPGKCKRYDFENRSELVGKIRSMLTDDLASEAQMAFSFTLQLFDDVADKHGLLAA